METEAASPSRQLPIVTDDLALRFVDTIDEPYGGTRFDHVGTYEGLLSWAVTAAVLTPDQRRDLARQAAAHPDQATRALNRAHQLRSALTDALPPDERFEKAWLQLRPFATDATKHLEYRTHPHLARTWPVLSRLDGLLWPIARAGEDLICGPDLARVKRCAGCPWLFVDHSRNGGRRWCDMNDCGKQEKMRRYTERRSARRQAARA